MNFVCSEVENMTISVNYYDFIKQMYENLTKYIKAYKSETNDYYKKINKLHEKYFPKLSGSKDEFKKSANIKTNHIISLSSKVPKIINQQILNLKYFISGIDTTIKSFDKTLKEKNSMSSKYQAEYDDCRNSLLKKYKDIDKSKNLYFTNASQTEELIYKFYISKSQNTEQNTPTSEVSSQITEIQMENNIKQTKKYEKEYLNLVKSAKPLEEKFFELSDSSKDNMKRIACEIITKMKDNIVDFLLLLKNCFKLPLSEIDTYLPELIKLDENKKIESIIDSTYKKDNSLIPIITEKYNIKIIKKQNENGDDEDNNNMIEEDEILNTIKKMEDNFELIEKNSTEQINSKIKFRTRELTFKLLSFSPNIIEDINNGNKEEEKKRENENNINNENNNNDKNNEKEKENENLDKFSITQEEIEELSKLIEDKGNRAIFLSKINTFRKYGLFEIPEKEFNIICDIFDKILGLIKKENDLSSVNNLILLSLTYYKLENNKKIFIQKIIKKNKLFKEKEFWEDLVNISILKEVQKHVNNDIKDPKFVDSHEAMENGKYEKIVFAQLLPLIKSMIDFELDDDIIKSIVQTVISYYKLKEESTKVIYDMIKYKGIKEEDNKKYYNLNLTIINEKDCEDNEIMNENNNKIENDDKNEKKNNEEDDENKINNELIVNVNQTLADEEDEDEDINNKMIKNLTSEEVEKEINSQMIKDIDDEEIDENENSEEKENNEKENKENKINEEKKNIENNNKS